MISNDLSTIGSQQRAIFANSSFVLLCVTIGGLGAEIFQIWASEVLGLTAGQVSVAFALMVLSIPVQLATVRYAVIYGPGPLMVFGYMGVLVGLAGMAVTTWLADQGMGSLTYALFLASTLWLEVCVSCSWGNAWLPWAGRIAPRDERPAFMRRMRFTTQAVYVAGLLLFTLLLANGVNSWHFYTLFAALAIHVTCAIVIFRSLPHARTSVEERDGEVESAALWEGLRNSRVRGTLALVLLHSLTAFPLLATWLLLNDYPAPAITTGGATQAVAGVAALVLLKRFIDGREAAKIVFGWGFAAAALFLVWIWIPSYTGTPSLAAYLALTAGTAIVMAGFNVGWFALLYDLLPQQLTTLGFALVDLVSSSSLQIYAFVIGGVLGLLSSKSLGLTLDLYRGVFALAALSITVIAVTALRVASRSVR